MKKILCLSIVMFIYISIQAQVCKIVGANSDNVEVFSCRLVENNSIVEVSVSNDSQDVSANVTVTVEVTYCRTQTYTGKGLAKPNQSTTIKIPISPKISNCDATSVRAISITGAKCDQ